MLKHFEASDHVEGAVTEAQTGDGGRDLGLELDGSKSRVVTATPCLPERVGDKAVTDAHLQDAMGTPASTSWKPVAV